MYIRSARPLRSTSSPIMMKRGMASQVQSLYVFHALVAIWFHRGASVKKYVRIKDVTPMAAATYSPPKKKAPIRPNAIPINKSAETSSCTCSQLAYHVASLGTWLRCWFGHACGGPGGQWRHLYLPDGIS